MPQLNFSPQFAASVADGSKRQTIRAQRKVPIKLDDTLHLFTGLRTKQALRLLPPQRCTAALWIRMNYFPPRSLGNRTHRYKIEIRLQEKGKLNQKQIEALALADGFESTLDFYNWFLPAGTDEFQGQLIKW